MTACVIDRGILTAREFYARGVAHTEQRLMAKQPRLMTKQPKREYATTKGHYYAYDTVRVDEYNVERRYNDPPAPQPPPGDGWELKSTNIYLSDGVNFLWSWQRDV